MILSRPVNQWVGLVSATAAFVQVLIVTLVPDINPVTVATVLGSLVAFMGILIAFIAAQPPTLNPGDPYTVVTPAGDANVTKVANTNVTAIPPVQG